MKQILCSVEPKVGKIPFHSSHIPPEKPSCFKIKLTLFHPPDEKLEKERKILFSIKKKKYTARTEKEAWKSQKLLMRAGALKYRPTPGIPSDQLCKSQERPACSLKCISALQAWGRCPCHTALPFPLCPGPKAARIPQARGSRCCWGYTDRRGGLISPRVCAGAGARRVRQPGRSLSYCSLCCTHPVEKSQMSA